MNIRNRIVENLRNRVHPVNVFTATNGAESFEEAQSTLKDLVREGLVEAVKSPLPGSLGQYVRGQYVTL